MAIPEFILRKLYAQGSFQIDAQGFSFALNNTFAPAALTGIELEVDGRPVPPGHLTLQAGEGDPRRASEISAEAPFPLPVGVVMTVRCEGVEVTEGNLTIHADTHEMGLLTFTIHLKAGASQRKAGRAWQPRRLTLPRLFQARLFQRPLAAEVDVDASAVIGQIHPYVYGHFVEHLERCVYGGIWTEDGVRMREDALALVRALKPPVIRYPGGNFASGYHWEDGIGPRDARPRRYDAAWQSWESNQVGTDEFLAYCAQVGTDPFLVVNDGSGTAGEAARWVAYCNQAEGEQVRRRAANGHAEPYGVRLWGVGNEVWGRWQIGHTDEQRAIATAIYYPFLIYRQMERLALRVRVAAPTFDSAPYGTIGGHRNVPYLDVTATCDQERRRLVLGLVNRHPVRKTKVQIAVRGLGALNPARAWLLTAPDPLAANTLDDPERVRVKQGPLPAVKGDRLRYEIPASSVAVLALDA